MTISLSTTHPDLHGDNKAVDSKEADGKNLNNRDNDVNQDKGIQDENGEDKEEFVPPDKERGNFKQWRKWQGGWNVPVTMDAQHLGQNDHIKNEDYEDKKNMMDDSDIVLQKALSLRHMSDHKSARNDVLNKMQNSLVKRKSRRRGPHAVKDPLDQLAIGADQVKKQLGVGLNEEWSFNVRGAKQGRVPDDKSEAHRAIKEDGDILLNNELHGRFEQSNMAPGGSHFGQSPSALRRVLGSFNAEHYLAAQRMLEGQGDPIRAFQFNQVASDATPPDRPLRDYRNPQ